MIHRTSVGLDVHARSIRGAAFVPETGEVIERGFGYDPAAVAGWVRSLPQPAWCVYESGPTGFDLQRELAVAGVECVAGAVSKMPRPSGDGVKADRRDAVFLARMLAVGNVVEARVPTRSMEACHSLCQPASCARLGYPGSRMPAVALRPCLMQGSTALFLRSRECTPSSKRHRLVRTSGTTPTVHFCLTKHTCPRSCTRWQSTGPMTGMRSAGRRVRGPAWSTSSTS